MPQSNPLIQHSQSIEHLHVGVEGETEAVSFLNANGYVVLEQNWRFKNHHEVDIIALSPDGDIVGIEVKTDTEPQEVAPFERVTREKITRLKQALELYVNQYTESEPAMRIDVISVVLRPLSIEHFVGVE